MQREGLNKQTNKKVNMSNYKVRGTITAISEKKVLDNGATVLDYVVDSTSDNGFVTRHLFNLYKKSEYAEHIDNFIKYNAVGNEVEVEFTIRSREYEGKIYNSLNHWKCDKVGMTPVESVVIDEIDTDPF